MAKQLSWQQRLDRALHVIRRHQAGKFALTTVQEAAMWREWRDVLEQCPHETLYEAQGTEYYPEPLGPDIPRDYHFIFCGLCHQKIEDFEAQRYMGYDKDRLGTGFNEDAHRVRLVDGKWVREGRYHIDPEWKSGFYQEPAPFIPFNEYWRKKYPRPAPQPSAQEVFERELAEHLCGRNPEKNWSS